MRMGHDTLLIRDVDAGSGAQRPANPVAVLVDRGGDPTRDGPAGGPGAVQRRPQRRLLPQRPEPAEVTAGSRGGDDSGIRDLLARLGDRWTVVVLVELSHGVRWFRE